MVCGAGLLLGQCSVHAVQGHCAPRGAQAWRCSLWSPRSAAGVPGLARLEGVGECRVLSGHLALAGGILGRSLAGSLSGCCSTPKTPEGPSWSGRVRPRKVSGAGGSQLGGPPPGLGEHLCRGLFVHSSQSWFPQLKCTGREKNRIIPCS